MALSFSKSNEFILGWKTLLACIIGVGVSLSSLYIYTNGLWITQWQSDFGWSRGEIGLGQTIATLMIVVGTPFAGMLIDRFGFKTIGLTSLVLYASCFYLLSQMDGSLTYYYLLSALLGILALPSMPVGFTKVINMWFNHHKGLALGMTLSGIGIGAIIIPSFLAPYVAENGWRSGQLFLFCVVLIAIPLIALLLREAPDANNASTAPNIQGDTSLKAALKTFTFWKLGMSFLIVSAGILGFIPSFIPLLQDNGVSSEMVGKLAAVLGISVVLGRIITGYFIDRFFAPFVIIVILSLAAIGCLTLVVGGADYAVVFALTVGFAIGAEIDLMCYLTAKYFGLKHYGSIYGVLFSLFAIGAAIGPTLTGVTWDYTGNYNLALSIAIALCVITMAIISTLPKYDMPAQ